VAGAGVAVRPLNARVRVAVAEAEHRLAALAALPLDVMEYRHSHLFFSPDAI
jgi:hypothetical protein